MSDGTYSVTREQMRNAGIVPRCPECGKDEDNPYSEHAHHRPHCRIAQYLAQLSLWKNAPDA